MLYTSLERKPLLSYRVIGRNSCVNVLVLSSLRPAKGWIRPPLGCRDRVRVHLAVAGRWDWRSAGAHKILKRSFIQIVIAVLNRCLSSALLYSGYMERPCDI
jgi:hypothetical protein